MEPRADRPHLPGYGVVPADEGEGLLPFSWAEERLAAARNYWVATVRPDGRPHLMAVWGIWLDQCFWFSTSSTSVRFRNLASEPRCVVAPEGADEEVVIEGRAERVTDEALLGRFVAAVLDKYAFDMSTMEDAPIFVVRPDKIFGIIEAEERFGATATRWTFTR